MKRRFECTLCGACCRRPGIVVMNDDELRAIAQFLEESTYDLVMQHDIVSEEGEWWMHLEDGECPFLEDDKCSVQPVKPVQCRTYPFWPEIVDSDQTWAGEKEHCPGIGIGRAYDTQEIAALVAEVDGERS